MKYRITFALLCLTVLSLLASCNGGGFRNAMDALETEDVEIKKYEPEYGGQLALPLVAVDSVNPLISESTSYYYFSKLIFEGLFELNEEYRVEPKLAETYSIEEDGLIKIRLKQNILWHDGESFTAKDVAFTINTIRYASADMVYKKTWKMLGNNSLLDINRIMDVNIVDDYNLEIKFDMGFGNCLEALTFPIIPSHVFIDNKEDKKAYIRALDREEYIPVGTGPFRFVDYEKHRCIHLEHFDDYREGRPYIDKIVGRIVKDEELALTTFEVGQIDLAMAVGVDWEKFAQIKRVKIFEFISSGYEFIGFNFTKPLFNNEKGHILRRAMAYGIDRQAIIQRVYLGHATQLDLPIHPNSWLVSGWANTYGYNPSKAKEELSKLGWKDIDNDGFYEDENHEEIIISITTNSYNILRLRTADMIVEYLNNLGIRTIKDYQNPIPENITDEMVDIQWEDLNKKLLIGDFDIILLGWNLPPVPELSFLFHSNQIKTGGNIIKYNNKIMDEALDEASAAINKNEKSMVYERLQRIMAEDLPYLSLFYRNKAILIDKKVMGNIEPTVYNIYRNINKWFIPKEFQETVDKS